MFGFIAALMQVLARRIVISAISDLPPENQAIVIKLLNEAQEIKEMRAREKIVARQRLQQEEATAVQRERLAKEISDFVNIFGFDPQRIGELRFQQEALRRLHGVANATGWQTANSKGYTNHFNYYHEAFLEIEKYHPALAEKIHGWEMFLKQYGEIVANLPVPLAQSALPAPTDSLGTPLRLAYDSKAADAT